MSSVSENLTSLRDQIQRFQSLLSLVDGSQTWSSITFDPPKGFAPQAEHHERHLISLTQDMSSALNEYGRLIQSGVRPAGSSIVNRCPDEILQHIFEYMIDGGSHLLGPILLVDRRFHQLILSSPRLWTNIRIQFNRFLDEENKLSPAFVRACVLNSQKRLLDVYIGILLFRSQQRFESRPSYSFYDSKLEHLSGLVRPVVGSNGSLMGRWRTFHLVIACRSISLYPWILGHFYGEVPNLQSLEIENISGDSHRNCLNDGYFASDNRQSLFSNMPNVRYVRVPIELSLEALSVSPRKLEHLYIVYTGCLQGLEQISRFSLLSELHIGCDSDTRDDPNHLVAYAMTISLPSLLLLTLSWEVELISHITFDVPNLRKWEFRSSRYDLQQYSQLGNIVSPLVEWHVDDYAVVEGEEWDEDDNSVGPSIRHLLKTIMSAESLKIFAKVTLDWADVALAIGEARRDNEIPPMIQSIEIHAKNGYRTWQPGMY